MENFMGYVYVSNIALCTILGMVLLFVKTAPLLYNHDYVIAKRFIALALFLVAIGVTANLFIGDVDDPKVEVLNIITLIIFDSQIILLTFALMTLYKSPLVSRKHIYQLTIPLIILIIGYLTTLIIDGDVCVYSYSEYFAAITESPALIIRTLILIWGIISAVICIRWFLQARRHFNNAIDNYFDGAKELHIQWVSDIFCTALILLGLVLFSYTITLPYWDGVAITGITILFIVIGIRFLTYPHLLSIIYPAIETAEEITISTTQINTIEAKLDKWTTLSTKPYTQKGVTISELADKIKENKRTLSKYLNTQRNINFNTWINTLRIEEAMRLLENKELPLYEIAEITGFSDLSKMSNFMKKHTGLTPSEYRKKIL